MAGAKGKGVYRWWITERDGNLAMDEHGLPRFGEMLNGNTTAGLNHMLETEFRSGTPVTTWYGGLIDNSGFSALASADTLASHGGWTENTANYSGNRKSWGPGAASGGSITNASAMAFTFTGSATIYGLFIASVASGTSGTLFSTAAFSSPQALVNTQVLNVTYTYTLS